MKRIANLKKSQQVECMSCKYMVKGDGVTYCDMYPQSVHIDSQGNCKDRIVK